MTDQELDAIIKRILIESIKHDCETEEKNDALVFHPSAQHRKQMRLMLKDPLRWSQRKIKPIWKDIAQKVALVFLIISLAFAALMASSPTVRATFVRWITEWYDTYIIYQYKEENVAENMPQYEITKLPEAFVESERTELPGIMSVSYQNETGDVISFEYMFVAQGGASVFNTENADIYDIEVNHMSGQFFESQVPGTLNTITWIDTKQNIQFDISGAYSYNDILHMAESVFLVKTPK